MGLNAERASKYLSVFLVVIGLVLVVACGSSAVVVPVADQSLATETAVPLPVAARMLAEGEFHLPATSAFGEPGFHEVLTATHNLPLDLGRMRGLRLVLKLWDAGRPELTCSSEHPLSGCSTVDWSDATGRPNVPLGGVFNNSITFQTVAGEHSFFLSESGALNDKPDAFEPG